MTFDIHEDISGQGKYEVFLSTTKEDLIFCRVPKITPIFRGDFPPKNIPCFPLTVLRCSRVLLECTQKDASRKALEYRVRNRTKARKEELGKHM